MKKIFLIIILLFCIFVIATGCKEEDIIVTVSFESNGGTIVESQKIKKGEKAVRPEDPIKEGYVFVNWYNGDTEFDFDTPIVSNLELLAIWEEDNSITLENLKETIVSLVETYKNSLTGAIKVQLINGEDEYNINLKYHLSATDKIVAYEYDVHQLISGHEINQWTYVKDDKVYSMITDNLGTDKLDKDATKHILKSCGVTTIIDSVLPFYQEDEFYNALSFSKMVDECTMEFVLDISKYAGNIIDVTNKDSIVLHVTVNENNISFIKLISTSSNSISNVGLDFKSLEVPIIDYPKVIE